MPFLARPQRLIRPLRDFLATESAGGVAVVGAALVALIWANSPWQASYLELWETAFQIRIGSWSLTMHLRELINESLMTIFFLVVGLEINVSSPKASCGTGQVELFLSPRLGACSFRR